MARGYRTLVDAARGETVHYDYEGPTTRRKRVTAPGQTVENTYDGPLLANETFSGDAVGTIARTYDGEMRITSSAVGTRRGRLRATTPTGCPCRRAN